ncbi:MAG: D-amino acid aminotransferase [Betaproteobacteria bacterium]|nr:D-amino acid aminotransferase [Betaproteobacteria bacterium]
MNDSLCFLNGTYQPLSEAKVPVLDRGFIFGDGVYEVVPVYGGGLFRFDAHMARLTRSLAKVGMGNPMTRDDWLAMCRKLVQAYALAQGTRDQMVYIQVTRGVAKRDHAFPKDVPQTVFAMTSPLPRVSDAQRAQGVACITTGDFRWHKGDIKSTSLLGAVLARQMSAEVGATETIMFRDGYLTEASASNVWVAKGGVLAAPVRDHLKLEGIRYALLEELCAAQGVPLDLRSITEREVREADEIILTSATKEVLAVTRLDGQPVGDGKPGPVLAKLYAAYQDAIRTQCV